MGIFGLILIFIAVIIAIFWITLCNEFPMMGFVIWVFTFFGTHTFQTEFTEKEVAIDCLKGNNPYKMEIHYILKDSIYVHSDTTYIKK